MQQKTKRPVQFELTEQTREFVLKWVNHAELGANDYLFWLFGSGLLGLIGVARRKKA